MQRTRIDTLPEGITYRDTGCEVSPRCLNCPLPVCKHDNPRAWQYGDVDLRNQAIVKERENGATLVSIAEQFGLSLRTVNRIMAYPDLRLDQGLGDGPALTSLKAYAGRSWVKQRQPWPKMPTPTGKTILSAKQGGLM